MKWHKKHRPIRPVSFAHEGLELFRTLRTLRSRLHRTLTARDLCLLHFQALRDAGSCWWPLLAAGTLPRFRHSNVEPSFPRGSTARWVWRIFISFTSVTCSMPFGCPLTPPLRGSTARWVWASGSRRIFISFTSVTCCMPCRCRLFWQCDRTALQAGHHLGRLRRRTRPRHHLSLSNRRNIRIF